MDARIEHRQQRRVFQVGENSRFVHDSRFKARRFFISLLDFNRYSTIKYCVMRQVQLTEKPTAINTSIWYRRYCPSGCMLLFVIRSSLD
jgi:hypothetical protein